MNRAVKIFSTLFAVGMVNPLWADTFTFEALTDFTDIDAGAVPYYHHNGVNALAINAAIEAYRDQFARATLEFPQATGQYDVTITSLGETDGDGEFRFLIDGVVVGSGVNEPASVDYIEQHHTFENITIPQGALIGVESIAVSNGLIPEGDAYAYARGRWTTLTITDVEPATATVDPIESTDLTLDIQVDNTSPTVSEELTFEISVDNLSTITATNPVVTVTFPAGIGNFVSDSCTTISIDAVSCELTELTAADTGNVTVLATALSAGVLDIEASVSADQPDANTSNNTATTMVEILNTVAPGPTASNDNTVDLALGFSADKDRVEVGDLITYTATITNHHASNTATSPVTGIALPDSLRFEASDICTADGSTILCETTELPPNTSAEVIFTATAVSVNSYSQLLATASAAQPENIVSNNETVVITDVGAKAVGNVDTESNLPADTNSDSTSNTASSETDSGGGALNPMILILGLLAPVVSHRRRNLNAQRVTK